MKPIYWLTLTSMLLAASSSAHPMGSKPFTHRLRIQLHQEGLEINYLAVIPETAIQKELEETGWSEDQFFQKKSEELQRGIRVFFDGTDYPLNPLDSSSQQIPERGTRSTPFEIRIQGPVFREQGTLSVTNTNAPNEHAFFHTTVRVESPIVVHDSSLFERQEDGKIRSWENQWTFNEEQRTMSFEVADWKRHSKRGPMQSAIGSSRKEPKRQHLFFKTLGFGSLFLLLAMRLKRRKKPDNPRAC